MRDVHAASLLGTLIAVGSCSRFFISFRLRLIGDSYSYTKRQLGNTSPLVSWIFNTHESWRRFKGSDEEIEFNKSLSVQRRTSTEERDCERNVAKRAESFAINGNLIMIPGLAKFPAADTGSSRRSRATLAREGEKDPLARAATKSPPKPSTRSINYPPGFSSIDSPDTFLSRI